MEKIFSVLAIGMKRSLPVAVAVGPGCTIETKGELKEAIEGIAGAEIRQHVGPLMNYSHLTEIDNLDIDVPSTALCSSAFPGVRVF